jgi:hypothetical protein
MTYVIAEPYVGVKDNSCAAVCPVDAIFAEDHLPSAWLRYAPINADHDKPRTAS